MKLTRGRAVALIGSAIVLPHCASGNANAIRVGSKNFSENITVAEIYAGALERAGLSVERHMNLGSTQIATAAMQRGDIQLYPEYTGTALIDVLHLPPRQEATTIFATIKQAYEQRFGLTWLKPAPANDSQGLAVTQAVAKKYGVRTLSQCARAAPQLRLAAVPEFVVRADALPGLQKYYGGFKFKSVRTFDIGLQYEALQRGDADAATVFTTDALIAANNLVVLQDDRHFWPPYNIAPVVRLDTLRAHPQIAATLNRIAPLLTDSALRGFNVEVDLRKREPAEVAAQFLKAHGS
ncbi:MAG TPA: glycine betaine ABC transporter substrate-binding protein [Candidatus Rubrimentiphilum sp.]|nr:glycine betaine ABC transporter substrate-binding protein [Candidatus Rubrimentiphilum sp.]